MRGEIDSRLALHRQKRGLSAARLAEMVGVSRQTIYAMEAGDYMPNTALALRLARVLEERVEDLFALSGDAPAPELPGMEATLLAGADAPHPGQPVQLGRVDGRLVASPPSPMPWYFPASDAVVAARPRTGGKANVRLLNVGQDFAKRILVAGCDPAISVLSRHLHRAGIELVLAHRNSSQALSLLAEGRIHIAGTHLRDASTGESNLPEIGRRFTRRSVAVISYAVWEEGIVTAWRNPKGIRGVDDLARSGVRMVNREAGAGSRQLLDAELARLGVNSRAVRGYQDEARGHLAAAWQVLSGAADCCIATRAAARVLGLGFIPLVSERYDLAIRRRHLELPGIQALLDVLSRTDFRRELEGLGGYDTSAAGRRML